MNGENKGKQNGKKGGKYIVHCSKYQKDVFYTDTFRLHGANYIFENLKDINLKAKASLGNLVLE